MALWKRMWRANPATCFSESASESFHHAMGEGACGGSGVRSDQPLPLQSRDVSDAASEEMQKGRVKGAKVVFARTHISSAKGDEKTLKIGYSDDIVVYLNQKVIFSGKNALSYRDDKSLGVFGLNDQIPIHLNAGDNELLVAVTEYNGGWAFECEVSPSLRGD